MHGPVGDPLLSMQIDFPDTTTGDLAGAAEVKEQALHIFRQLNNRYGEETTLLNLGEVALVREGSPPPRLTRRWQSWLRAAISEDVDTLS